MPPKPHVFCHMCDYFSESNDACFYPDALLPSFPFKEFADYKKLNSDYNCSWYEPVKVYPDVHPGGRRYVTNRLVKFFAGLLKSSKPWKARIK